MVVWDWKRTMLSFSKQKAKGKGLFGKLRRFYQRTKAKEKIKCRPFAFCLLPFAFCLEIESAALLPFAFCPLPFDFMSL
jgi:hypothetical protein